MNICGAEHTTSAYNSLKLVLIYVLLCYFCLLFHKMCTHVIFKSWLCWLKIYLHHSLWFIQSIHRWSSRITVVHIFRVYLKEFLLIDTYACFGLGLYV